MIFLSLIIFRTVSSLTGNNVKELFTHVKKELEEQKRYILNNKRRDDIIRINEPIKKNNLYPDLTGRLNKCCF